MYKVFCRSYQKAFKGVSFVLPWREPKIIKGKNSILRLGNIIKKENLSKILIVTDKGIKNLGLMDPMLESLDECGVKYVIYDETTPNPTIGNIEEALQLYKENKCQGLIAFGGGSPMDCAKGVAARVVKPKKEIPKLKGVLKVRKKIPPFFAIPTTSGTGSEATLAAVISNPETSEKYAINDIFLIPHFAVLDPMLTKGLPKHITSTTGIDALTHAVEAYIGQSNTKLTRERSKKAVKLIFENLYEAYIDGENMVARANMQEAAYHAGVAFTRAYVGNVHAIAHTLSGFYHTPHGLANAVLLPHTLEFYGHTVYKSLWELAEVAGIGSDKDSYSVRAIKFITAIRELNDKMEIPKEFDFIEEKDIPLMVSRAFKEANPLYPVPMIFSKKDFEDIYRQVSSNTEKLKGYAGKIARVDLTTQSVITYPMPAYFAKKYVGGKTLAAKIIYDEYIMNDEPIDPLSDDNIIVITTAPITATASPCSSRFNVSTISPLTKLLVSSNCGGNFGINLKKAGYDALIISGRSEEKVYIDIKNENIDIKNANHLWGKSTSETQTLIGEKTGGKLVIGVAGENLIPYASVINEERAVGRGGVGALFGMKNLKGITAKGTVGFGIYNKDELKKYNQKWIKTLQNHPITGKQLPELGTAGLVSMMQDRHLLATKNYKYGTYDKFDSISGETLRDKHLVKNKGCITCPIQCGRVVTAYGKNVKGPELETLGLLGSNLLNDNLQKIININHLCDEYGLDTITFGSTIGLAMELNEKGLWKNDLSFGNNENLEELVEMVAKKEGIGKDIALGTKELSKKYGGEDFAMHVKGMELAAYEPRGAQGMGLGYATSNRGGCHLNGGYMVVLEGLGLDINRATTKGKAEFTIFFQDFMEAASSAGSCLFTTYAALPGFLIEKKSTIPVKAINKMVPVFGPVVGVVHKKAGLIKINLNGFFPHPHCVELITGRKVKLGDFVRVGERGYNLERLINVKQGVSSKDDTLPKRLIKELEDKDNPNSKVKLDQMLNKYYSIRGWNEKGIPTEKTINKIKL